MIQVLLYLFGFFFWLFISILFHEIGHVMYMQTIYPKRKIKISTYYNSVRDLGFMVGKQKDYDDMTNKQYFMSNFAGITGGLLFIILGTYFIQPYISFLVVPYL